MKLVIPSTYPNQDPLLYICPEKGTKVFPIEGVVDSSGRISPYLASGIKSMYLIDFFAQLDRYFAVTFPLCVDPTSGLIDECKKVMEPEYYELYDEAKQKDKELKQLTKSIEDTSTTIEDTLATLEPMLSSLKQRHQQLERKLQESSDIRESLKGEKTTVESDYRSAFTFGSENQRMLLELTACEKTCSELHEVMSMVLARDNMEEVVDIIRENGRELFEARYLKDIVNARFNSSSVPTLQSRFIPSVPKIY